MSDKLTSNSTKKTHKYSFFLFFTAALLATVFTLYLGGNFDHKIEQSRQEKIINEKLEALLSDEPLSTTLLKQSLDFQNTLESLLQLLNSKQINPEHPALSELTSKKSQKDAATLALERNITPEKKLKNLARVYFNNLLADFEIYLFKFDNGTTDKPQLFFSTPKENSKNLLRNRFQEQYKEISRDALKNILNENEGKAISLDCYGIEGFLTCGLTQEYDPLEEDNLPSDNSPIDSLGFCLFAPNSPENIKMAKLFALQNLLSKFGGDEKAIILTIDKRLNSSPFVVTASPNTKELTENAISVCSEHMNASQPVRLTIPYSKGHMHFLYKPDLAKAVALFVPTLKKTSIFAEEFLLIAAILLAAALITFSNRMVRNSWYDFSEKFDFPLVYLLILILPFSLLYLSTKVHFASETEALSKEQQVSLESKIKQYDLHKHKFIAFYTKKLENALKTTGIPIASKPLAQILAKEINVFDRAIIKSTFTPEEIATSEIELFAYDLSRGTLSEFEQNLESKRKRLSRSRHLAPHKKAVLSIATRAAKSGKLCYEIIGSTGFMAAKLEAFDNILILAVTNSPEFTANRQKQITAYLIFTLVIIIAAICFSSLIPLAMNLPGKSLILAFHELKESNFNINLTPEILNETGNLCTQLTTAAKHVSRHKLFDEIMRDYDKETSSLWIKDSILEQSDDFKGTILVTSLKNWDDISQSLNPRLKEKLLNRFAIRMSWIIRYFGGKIYKIPNGRIEAFFENTSSNHIPYFVAADNATQKAVYAHMCMKEEMILINREMAKDLEKPVEIKSGLSYGSLRLIALSKGNKKYDHAMVSEKLKTARDLALNTEKETSKDIFADSDAQKQFNINLKNSEEFSDIHSALKADNETDPKINERIAACRKEANETLRKRIETNLGKETVIDTDSLSSKTKTIILGTVIFLWLLLIASSLYAFPITHCKTLYPVLLLCLILPLLQMAFRRDFPLIASLKTQNFIYLASLAAPVLTASYSLLNRSSKTDLSAINSYAYTAIPAFFILGQLLIEQALFPYKKLLKGIKSLSVQNFSFRTNFTEGNLAGQLCIEFDEMMQTLEISSFDKTDITLLKTPIAAYGSNEKTISRGSVLLKVKVSDFTELQKNEPQAILALKLKNYAAATIETIENDGGEIFRIQEDEITGVFSSPLKHPKKSAKNAAETLLQAAEDEKILKLETEITSAL
ncbi:MAG: hypothetical protein GX221_03745 [Candidatus Riflebacteria bacterium]|nr:hypothetical protein [Candidatus Riflebacteria bacterium]